MDGFRHLVDNSHRTPFVLQVHFHVLTLILCEVHFNFLFLSHCFLQVIISFHLLFWGLVCPCFPKALKCTTNLFEFSQIFFFLLSFLNAYGCFSCMDAFVSWVCSAPECQERVLDFLGLKLQMAVRYQVGSELNPSLLEDRPVLLTAESCLWAHTSQMF